MKITKRNLIKLIRETKLNESFQDDQEEATDLLLDLLKVQSNKSEVATIMRNHGIDFLLDTIRFSKNDRAKRMDILDGISVMRPYDLTDLIRDLENV